MKLKDSIIILMNSATNDVRGSGMGYRNTTEEHRKEVAKAWKVAFKYVYKRDPGINDSMSAGMYFHLEE